MTVADLTEAIAWCKGAPGKPFVRFEERADKNARYVQIARRESGGRLLFDAPLVVRKSLGASMLLTNAERWLEEEGQPPLEENVVRPFFSDDLPRPWLSFWVSSETVLAKLVILSCDTIMNAALQDVQIVKGDAG